jgi:hypothetical protein
MQKAWFEEVIADWGDLGFTDGEQETLRERVMELATAFGARLVADIETIPNLDQQYAVYVARDALDKRAAYLAGRLREDRDSLAYSVETRDWAPYNEFMKASEVRRRIDLNSATAEEIAALPKIGDVVAARIVAARNLASPWASIEDLPRIQGVGRVQKEILEDASYSLGETRPSIASTAAVDAFRNRPTFAEYVRIIQSGAYIGATDAPPADAAAIRREIVQELRRTVEWAKGQRGASRRRLKTRASEARDQLAAAAAHDALLESAKPCTVCGTVFNTDYRDATLQLIHGAEERVWVAMFFMVYGNDEEYPIRSMVNALIAAQERGLDVRVLLDRDRPEDPYSSSEINAPAARALRDAGVSVRFDPPEQAIHSKVLIIDGHSVLAGSHNWTAGSIFQYEDVSFLLESPELSQEFGAWFQELWDAQAD